MQDLDVLAAQLDAVRPDEAGEVLRGKGEWLFEGNGGRRVLAQMRGDMVLSRKAALRWIFILESRAAWLATRGIASVFGVAPCKSVVLAEHLPHGVVLSPRRPVVHVQSLIDADEAASAQIVYPLDELRAETAQRPTFSTHESRWNANGAFVAYRRLLDALPPDVAARRLARGEVAFEQRPAAGDLGDRLAPPVTGFAMAGRPQPSAAHLISDNRVAGEGRMIVTGCDAAPDTTCLFVGEWSAYRMFAFMAESFRRLVFVHLRALDHALVETESPGAVIFLADETGMIDLPGDIEAPRADELAARKLSAVE